MIRGKKKRKRKIQIIIKLYPAQIYSHELLLIYSLHYCLTFAQLLPPAFSLFISLALFFHSICVLHTIFRHKPKYPAFTAIYTYIHDVLFRICRCFVFYLRIHKTKPHSIDNYAQNLQIYVTRMNEFIDSRPTDCAVSHNMSHMRNSADANVI